VATLAIRGGLIEMRDAPEESRPRRGASKRSGKKGISREEMRIRLRLEPFGLTKKETEIVLLMLEGASREALLTSCSITNNTLKSHIRQIYRKLRISRREELAERVRL